jgi:NTE family protein
MKIGLVLGGGGARGSYQLGVLKALYEEGILNEVSFSSGTSIGAINTLLLTMGMNFKEMVNTWKAMTNKQVYGQGLNRFENDGKGLFSIREMYDKISGVITEEHMNHIEHSKIKGYITTCEITSNKPYIFEQLNLLKLKPLHIRLDTVPNPIDYTLASASIPYFFGYYEIDNKRYVDGGVKFNLPIEPILDKCDLFIVVPNFKNEFKEKKYSLYNKTFIIVEPTHLFTPVRGLVDIIDFDPNEVMYKAHYGYKLMKECIKEMKENGILNSDSTFNVTPNYLRFNVPKNI